MTVRVYVVYHCLIFRTAHGRYGYRMGVYIVPVFTICIDDMYCTIVHVVYHCLIFRTAHGRCGYSTGVSVFMICIVPLNKIPFFIGHILPTSTNLDTVAAGSKNTQKKKEIITHKTENKIWKHTWTNRYHCSSATSCRRARTWTLWLLAAALRATWTVCVCVRVCVCVCVCVLYKQQFWEQHGLDWAQGLGFRI